MLRQELPAERLNPVYSAELILCVSVANVANGVVRKRPEKIHSCEEKGT